MKHLQWKPVWKESIMMQKKRMLRLYSIQDENGGEYHSDKAGTYIASYMVVPKDQSDSYTISRKVILTDTEGQAHARGQWWRKAEVRYKI
ncbi:hypothetical protein [Eubacterium ramulus]|uniref:hypothetical protein n=1 Tax=Eubacterium ramulus TaxID=39490 RepID=UPI00399AAC9C